MAVTIKDIARKAGVTHATVSYVLNNKGKKKGLTEETIKRVFAVAKDLNYRRNIVAKNLATRQTNVIGILIPCVTHSFWPQFARSVEDTARENGYRVFLCHMDNDYRRETEEINLLREHRVAGLIITPVYNRQDANIFLQLQKDKVPFVLIDQCLNGLEYNFVGTDDRGIGKC